jgi:hypothetical protein
MRISRSSTTYPELRELSVADDENGSFQSKLLAPQVLIPGLDRGHFYWAKFTPSSGTFRQATAVSGRH